MIKKVFIFSLQDLLIEIIITVENVLYILKYNIMILERNYFF